MWQAGLAVMTIVLTLVIVFAMTAAWYTNIVQTSGLVFEAEAWGFEGTIQVNSDPIVAGPGDDGVIHLQVANESDNHTAVSVSVSKMRMTKDMQKRLYFYVDTQVNRNGETMERVYLNSQEAYTYTLFSNGSLTLTETVHNGAQLKWQWVYDVLGYYVLGTATADGTEVTISEYLRPIEYDYDQATIVATTDGNGEIVSMEIQTVDGEMTPEEFLAEVSKTDGYDGTIDTEQKSQSGYYPVNVDENGYGVYAYLCDYTEVEMEIQFDTTLGQVAADAAASEEDDKEPLRYEAQLTVSAQKNKNSVVNANSLTALNTAIELGVGDVIQLTGDITLTDEDYLEIAAGKRVMLDLNGNKIISQGSQTPFQVNEGGSLTLVNGTVDGTDSSASQALRAIGAEAVLSNVTITGFEDGVRIADNEGTQALDSAVRLVNCQVDAESYGVLIKGNGSTSAQNTQLIVEGCTVSGGDVGIGGNGSEAQSGTDIQILNSTVSGKTDAGQVSTGIFHPQENGMLTVYQSSVSGYTGMAIKGGSVHIDGSTVKGTGARRSPQFATSGCSDTGDGIYIETNYDYAILLEIWGASKIESEDGYSLQVYKADADNVTVRIYSGIFDEVQPEAYIDKNSLQTGSTITEKTTEASE